MMTSVQGLKLALAAVLVLSVALAALARAPRGRSSRIELRRLMLCASALYAVGLVASLTQHGSLAALVYAAGIGICALALWLSRGSDPGDPPDGPDDPGDEQPPPDPGGAPAFDWAAFERQFRDYAERDREKLAT
jgi:lysylphosphatidylglycerol synthetase-like protein (DUF2156 family)